MKTVIMTLCAAAAVLPLAALAAEKGTFG